MITFPNRSEWRDDFVQKREIKDALQILRKNLDDGDRTAFEGLASRLVKACYDASRFSRYQAHDYLERSFDNESLFREQRQEIIGTIRKLKRYSSAYPMHFSLALKGVSIGQRGVIPATHDDPTKGPSRDLAGLLDGLEAAISAASGNRLANGNIVGCLDYGTDVRTQNSQPEHILSGLMFELVLVIRSYRGGEPTEIRVPASMPTDGKPCYEAVAGLLNATLPALDTKKSMTAEKVRGRLSNLLLEYPKVRFVGWYDHRES